jgi:hypothetical protein
MTRILSFGLICALAPLVLARLHFLLGGLTRALVYILAAAQILMVPVLVALDPDISFGSDAYSLGAGVGIMLITAIESVFVLGTVLGVLAGTSYINRREHAADVARAAAMFSAAPAEIFPVAPAAMPELEASAVAAPASFESTEPSRPDTVLAAESKIEATAPRQSVGLNLVGAYLCFVLASSGATILIEGLSSGNYVWIRNFGAVSLADRPISFAAVTVIFLTPTFAAGWGAITLLFRVWRRFSQVSIG